MNISVKGERITRVTTCFKYRGEKIFFEISLEVVGFPYSVLFLRTNDYIMFRKVFKDISDLRAENRAIILPGHHEGSLAPSQQSAA